MKLNADKIKEAETWVEKNGLFPQACGSSLRDFCAAMGINDATYRRWLKKAEFADALSRARDKFKAQTVREVENALVKAALGVDYVQEKQEGRAQVVKEYDPKTGKKIKEYTTDKMVTTKAQKIRVYYPPNVEAAKFVLSNMNPENWRMKQDQTIQAEVTQYVVKNEEEKKKLEDIGKGDV